ncbi:type II toxin-antitoxin system VapC family toxin [Streptomyces sp. 4N509B]|uniref:type II toxin-antitoxin system VapC family toxin n=1 Tax=Streptomyces sp. 4N509B TaxID=3457413 RepID=UPI003FD2098C
MSLYYVDTSAALKLLVEEKHSRAFADFYDQATGATWVSSALLRIEMMRAVTRAFPAVLPEARELLLAFEFVTIEDDIVDVVMNEPDRMLRSFDAIHLATARVLRPDLTGLVTYDDRLAATAEDAGFTVVSPRD